MLTLADLYEALTQTRVDSVRSIAIPQVTIDSRQAQVGSLFIALQGEKRDGHEFISDALARGAVAIIAERRGGRGLGPNVHLIDATSQGVAGLQPSPPPLPWERRRLSPPATARAQPRGARERRPARRRPARR